MGVGSFVLVLHSHLPFYRKAGMWPFGEENLYECMAETYIPLLNMLHGLLKDGIRANITIGVTPILCEQLNDPHLQQGFIDYAQTRIEAAGKDLVRYQDFTLPNAQHYLYLAKFYVDHYQSLIDDFITLYDRNLLGGFKFLQDQGCIEIITSGATHGFSPLLGTDASVNAQFKVGADSYRRHFGKAPKGVWLPECAYRPSEEVTDPVSGKTVVRPPIDAFLFENGLEYFFTEHHAIEGGVSSGARRVVGIYGNIQYLPLPARPATGQSTYEAYWLKDYPVSVMGRNDRASFQVWSAAHGYPGDGVYREFHKKDESSGMHYWRLTSKDADLADKVLYDPDVAFKQTKPQAEHFAELVYSMLQERKQATGEPGLIMVSFDTELFGHWWFEGVEWLKHVILGLRRYEGLAMQTAGDYLTQHPPKAALALPESTWGQGGHFWVWQNHHTEWMWPIIHSAEEQMVSLADEYGQEQDPVKIRILNQAARELLLLESSDWPFLITTFQAKDYAIERFTLHQENFWALVKMLETGQIDTETLEFLEEKDNPFPHLDYHTYQSNHKATREAATPIL